MKLFFTAVVMCFLTATVHAQPKTFSVIAYFAGNTTNVDAYPIEKLTHIIFSFCHLKGNKLFVNNLKDSLMIQHLVLLKQRNPSLKVLLSLGGWGGCAPCSAVFATRKGRKQFARSAKRISKYFKTDGIDLDWEYPAIAGFPGHAFVPEDKHNFTLLIEALRKKFKHKYTISFAAGGFSQYLQSSVEWDKVTPLVNNINVMTYDLVHGASKVTGHHTPLFSTAGQIESTDHAVHFLDSVGVPKNKIVIGAAFYARVFDVDTSLNNGLYQAGKFHNGIDFFRFNKDSLLHEGFNYYWDDAAKAPYLYAPAKKQFITYDDEQSILLKTKYVMEQQLNGIMFWDLNADKTIGGLLEVIDKTLHQ